MQAYCYDPLIGRKIGDCLSFFLTGTIICHNGMDIIKIFLIRVQICIFFYKVIVGGFICGHIDWIL